MARTIRSNEPIRAGQGEEETILDPFITAAGKPLDGYDLTVINNVGPIGVMVQPARPALKVETHRDRIHVSSTCRLHRPTLP